MLCTQFYYSLGASHWMLCPRNHSPWTGVLSTMKLGSILQAPGRLFPVPTEEQRVYVNYWLKWQTSLLLSPGYNFQKMVLWFAFCLFSAHQQTGDNVLLNSSIDTMEITNKRSSIILSPISQLTLVEDFIVYTLLQPSDTHATSIWGKMHAEPKDLDYSQAVTNYLGDLG